MSHHRYIQIEKTAMLLVLLGLIMAPNGATKAAEEISAKPRTLEQIRLDLASPDFAVRQRTQLELEKAADDLFSELKTLSESPDPEVATRAKAQLRRYLTGLNDQTKEETKQKINDFSRSSVEAKLRIAKDLSKTGEYQALFGLYLMEENQEHKDKLKDFMPEVTRQLVREAIFENKVNRALHIFNNAPEHPECEFDFANFLVTQRLELPKSASPRLRVFHLIVQDEFEKALALAEKSTGSTAIDSKLIERIKVSLGDARPYLQTQAKKGNEVSSALVAQYLQAQERNDKDQMTEMRKLIVRSAENQRRKNFNSRLSAIAELVAVGELEQAKTYSKELYARSMIPYYENQEMSKEVFELLEVKDISKAGFRKHFQENPFIGDDNLEDRDRYLSLYAFMYLAKRGEYDFCLELIDEQLELITEDKRAQAFESLLADNLFRGLDTTHSFLYIVAKKFVAYTGKNQEETIKILSLDTSSGAILPQLASLVKLAHPELQGNDLMLRLMALMRYRVVAESQRVAWLRELSQALEKLEPQEGQTKKPLQELNSILISIGDAYSAVEGLKGNWSTLENTEKQQLASLLSMQGEWQLLREQKVQLDDLAQDQDSRVLCAPYLETHTEKRKELQKRTESYILGDDFLRGQSVQIAKAAGEKVDSGRHILRRLVCIGKISEESMSELLQSEVEKANWQRASALATFAVLQTCMPDGYQNITNQRSMILNHKLVYNEQFTNYRQFCTGILFYSQGRGSDALSMIEKSVTNSTYQSLVADVFFPALNREPQLKVQADQYFEEIWKKHQENLKLFPHSPMGNNGLAWVAARAVRRLNEADQYVKKALNIQPGNGAIIDTQAEVMFAKGNREDAIKTSSWAKRVEPAEISLIEQYYRFQTAPFPRK